MDAAGHRAVRGSGQVLRAWVLGPGCRTAPSRGRTSGSSARRLTPRGRTRTRNCVYLGNLLIPSGSAWSRTMRSCWRWSGRRFASRRRQLARSSRREESFLRPTGRARVFEDYCGARGRGSGPDWLRGPGARGSGRVVARALRKEHNPLAAWARSVVLLLAFRPGGAARAAGAPAGLSRIRPVALRRCAAARIAAAWLAVRAGSTGGSRGGFTDASAPAAARDGALSSRTYGGRSHAYQA